MARKRKYEYRYRYASSTERGIKKFSEHVHKVGKLVEIRGYRYFHNGIEHEAVMVKGVNGHLRLNCFCWGYYGEGPRGIAHILMLMGIPKELAQNVANNTKRTGIKGTDWSIKVNDGVLTTVQKMR